MSGPPRTDAGVGPASGTNATHADDVIDVVAKRITSGVGTGA